MYENLKKGAASGQIEQYLERLRARRSGLLRPPPASSRPSFQDERILMSLPIAMEKLARRGRSPEGIRNAVLPYDKAGFRVLDWHPISDGFEVLVGLSRWRRKASQNKGPTEGALSERRPKYRAPLDLAPVQGILPRDFEPCLVLWENAPDTPYMVSRTWCTGWFVLPRLTLAARPRRAGGIKGELQTAGRSAPQ